MHAKFQATRFHGFGVMDETHAPTLTHTCAHTHTYTHIDIYWYRLWFSFRDSSFYLIIHKNNVGGGGGGEGGCHRFCKAARLTKIKYLPAAFRLPPPVLMDQG